MLNYFSVIEITAVYTCNQVEQRGWVGSSSTSLFCSTSFFSNEKSERNVKKKKIKKQKWYAGRERMIELSKS